MLPEHRLRSAHPTLFWRLRAGNEDVEQDEGRFSDYLDLKQRKGLISMQISNNKQRMLQARAAAIGAV